MVGYLDAAVTFFFANMLPAIFPPNETREAGGPARDCLDNFSGYPSAALDALEGPSDGRGII